MWFEKAYQKVSPPSFLFLILISFLLHPFSHRLQISFCFRVCLQQFAITHRDWGRDYGPSLESWISALDSHYAIKKAQGDERGASRIQEERRLVCERLELLQNKLYNITPPNIVL